MKLLHGEVHGKDRLVLIPLVLISDDGKCDLKRIGREVTPQSAWM